MQHKTKIILISVLASLLTLNTGYLIYEACSTKENSLAYKLTHHEYDVNLKDNKVNEIKLNNKSEEYLVNETYKLDYEVLPLDAFDPSVTIKSSDTSRVEIVNDSFKVKSLGDSSPVTITITSNENTNISKELIVNPAFNPLENITHKLSNNLIKVQDEGEPLPYYKIKQNEVFNVSFTGFSNKSKPSNEEMVIETSKSITRINDSSYYFINSLYIEGSPCFIKARSGSSNGIKTEDVLDFAKDGILENNVKEIKFFLNNIEVEKDKLEVNKTYKLKAFDASNNEVKNVPLIIKKGAYESNYDEIRFLEANNYEVKYNLFNEDKTILGIKVNDVVSSDFELSFLGNYKSEDESIKTYLNRGFRYEIVPNDLTFKSYEVKEVNDLGVIEIKDNFIQAKRVGKTKIEVTPKETKYKEYKKVYDVEVLPLEKDFNINEIYIFGSIFLVSSILITVLIYLLISKKNTLYTLFTFLAGFIFIGVYSLVCLVSKIRYPSISLFFIYYLIYLIGALFTYIFLVIMNQISSKNNKKSELKS